MNTMVIHNQGQTFPFSLFAQQHFSGQATRLMRWKGFNSNVTKADVNLALKPLILLKV
ncbi:MAG: hypothetical protein ACJAXS_002619 [Colwellia sp.]|jgi:hypothetical protein